MKILALEFSSLQRSVAIVNAVSRPDRSGDPVISAVEVVETGIAGTHALGMVEEVLRRSGLDREQVEGIAVGLGPGSYTGIRAAIAIAQGWQLARDIKLMGVSSVVGIVTQAQADGLIRRVSVVVDAQREEFYLATYEVNAHRCNEIAPLRVASREEVRDQEKAGQVLIGPEISRWFEHGRIVLPRAEIIGRLAVAQNIPVKGEQLEPIYLRETKFVKAPAPRIL